MELRFRPAVTWALPSMEARRRCCILCSTASDSNELPSDGSVPGAVPDGRHPQLF